MMADQSAISSTLIAETGDIDTTTTGYKSSSFAAPITLQPGWYFIGVLSNAAIGVRQPPNTFFNAGQSSNFDFGSAFYALLDCAGSAGWTAMPSTLPSTGWNGVANSPMGLTLTRA